MTDVIGTSLSGLLSFQRNLATTSHNIANVNTEGFSRQRVNLVALPAESIGGTLIGQGVGVAGIDRVIDGFQVAEVRENLAQQGRLEVFSQLSRELDSLLGSTDSGLSPALQGFFEGVQAAADDPSSTAARQSLLSQAGVLADRFESLDTRLAAQQAVLTDRLSAAIPEVNALASALATLNTSIAEFSAASGGTPNDLLDQRDQVLSQLSQQLSVEVVTENDGSLNVFIASGQALVLGGEAGSLRVSNGEFGNISADVFLDSPTGTSLITSGLQGGEIGGLLDADRELISPSRNQLGQLSIALSRLANDVHSNGLTLSGELGGDLFSVGPPQSFQSFNNTGNASIDLTIADESQLSASDYQFVVNGADTQLIRLDTKVDVPLSGSGTVADPYVADGFEFVVSGTPEDGDTFLLQPTSGAAGSLSVVINDPAELALASPVAASLSLTNSGTLAVDSVSVVNSDNSALLDTVSIEFLSESTFSIDGAGSFSFESGEPIEINGWQLTLTGTPEPGDQLEVELNAGGVGDNRNALALGEVLDEGVLNDGNLSVQSGYSVLLSNVSTSTQQAEIRLTAQSTITQQSIDELQSVSGVNLDEEAANLLRFQQAYQAAAQVLGVADSLFQTLLGAVGR